MSNALQDIVFPEGSCFGCGPSNEKGLKIKSYWDNDKKHVLAQFTPSEEHCGWPSLVYGGLISCLIDCHSNWTAMASHYVYECRDPGSSPRIDCVTGTLNIKYIKPTPMGVELRLKAWVEGDVGRKTNVKCEVYAGDLLTCVSDSIFVKVNVDSFST